MNDDEQHEQHEQDDDEQHEQHDDEQDHQQHEQDDEQDDDEQDDDEQDGDEQDGDTFPRKYVERLRARSAGYRARAKDADERVTELERSLFTERVRALDLLADPADLPYDADLLEDGDALQTAAEDLVRKRPHYRRRGTTDSSGTGSRERSSAGTTVSLTDIMRGHG